MPSRMLRVGLIQATWTGDRQSMLDKHEKYVRDAAGENADAVCLQEVFNAPFFPQVNEPEFYEWAEPVPGGPTVSRFAALARELHVVLVCPVYESTDVTGEYYNAAAVIDADGSYLGTYRKNHIPNLPGFWEKYYFRPGNLDYPVFDTMIGKVGVYICYDRHFPEGWRELGLGGAELVFNPSATSRSLSSHLWQLEQPAAAAANGYFVATINRVGTEPYGENDFYGSSYVCDPRGQIVEATASDQEEYIVRDIDLDLVRQVRHTWQFYRDRRPETYARSAQR